MCARWLSLFYVGAAVARRTMLCLGHGSAVLAVASIILFHTRLRRVERITLVALHCCARCRHDGHAVPVRHGLVDCMCGCCHPEFLLAHVALPDWWVSWMWGVCLAAWSRVCMYVSCSLVVQLGRGSLASLFGVWDACLLHAIVRSPLTQRRSLLKHVLVVGHIWVAGCGLLLMCLGCWLWVACRCVLCRCSRGVPGASYTSALSLRVCSCHCICDCRVSNNLTPCCQPALPPHRGGRAAPTWLAHLCNRLRARFSGDAAVCQRAPGRSLRVWRHVQSLVSCVWRRHRHPCRCDVPRCPL